MLVKASGRDSFFFLLESFERDEDGLEMSRGDFFKWQAAS